MKNIRFFWDEKKASSNLAKHGVTFEEAKTVFYDDYASFKRDPDHSIDEDRFILMGLSSQSRILIVCHCYRESGSVIRIFSARRASRKERKFYRGVL